MFAHSRRGTLAISSFAITFAHLLPMQVDIVFQCTLQRLSQLLKSIELDFNQTGKEYSADPTLLIMCAKLLKVF